MNITVPVYVRAHGDQFTVSPLFFDGPVQRHEKLERVLHLLARDLRKEFHELGRDRRHDDLAERLFNPELDTHRLDLVIELRKRVVRGRYFFVVLHTLGRRVAFTPGLPDVWFELGRGENLADRAAEVLTAVFRQREKDDDEGFVPPEKFALEGTAWVTPLDLDIYPAQVIEKAEDRRAALFGSEEELDGQRELFRVARCLDQLYPEDLDRVLLRDREVEELTRLLRADDRRPVLLLGPPLTGKTALLHEYVWRTVAGRHEPFKIVNYTWLLAPARLISGMSYVGQWENRLLAILREARKQDHILYFDDFLGLYYAGQTGQSELSVALVLKPYVERREVRVVAEMTPEAFRVLRERDRGFADQFHVLPLAEPPPRDVLRILIAVQRQLETQHRCRFDLDVLPTVLDLQRRYVRHQSFPGKAALFLRRLAVRNRTRTITRQDVLNEFHAQSGLVLSFLDGREKLDPAEVVAAMEAQVIGQPEALTAAAEVVSIARARLNDPERPLASFLFLGPTGVGKTQCAKALAAYLFGSAEKLLRFDMNEYVEPGSAARLVGTFSQPEGLLTAALRRQPFAVVLLDEIEKADGEVFDLLLQVLGEGRLTDALGRTADFSNAIVILTSNLGVREASSSLGYAAGDSGQRAAYVQAAERFFRPEFFNRLDRIVPFERLQRADVARIARMLLTDLFQREGLVRRKCILRVESHALERIIERGFDPVLGARALKRALERQLTQPVAACLAAGVPQTLTVIHVYAVKDELAVAVRGLQEAARLPERGAADWQTDEAAFLAKARAALRRMEEQFEPLRPQGEITATSLAGEHVTYFTVQNRLRALAERLRELSDQLEHERQSSRGVSEYAISGDLHRLRTTYLRAPGKVQDKQFTHLLQELAAAQDVHLFLEELAAQATGEEWLDPLDDFAVARLLTECCLRPQPERVLVHIWSSNEAGRRWSAELTRALEHAFCSLNELGTDQIAGNEDGDNALVVTGLMALPVARLEEGTHLFCPKREGFQLVQVQVWPMAARDDGTKVLCDKRDQRRRWQEALARGEAGPNDDPFPLLPVLRVYHEGGSTLDLRTGRVGSGTALTRFLTAPLPLPFD